MTQSNIRPEGFPPPKADPLWLARNSVGLGMKDTIRQIDMKRMRGYRLGRVQQQIRKAGVAGALIFGSINVRYATGTRFASLFNLHSPFRGAFVPPEGPVTLFDWERCYRDYELPETVGEVRDAGNFCYFPAGENWIKAAADWAGDVAELVRKTDAGNKKLAVDMIEPVAILALQEAGFEIAGADDIMEHAKLIKSPDEIVCILNSISVAETGFGRMREALKPGITEQQLWALLVHANAEQGGEWIEYKLLSSGGRNNPWFQETSDRIVRAGELVAFDAGMVGPMGYCADVSRTFFCKPGKPTPEQKKVYQLAHENIQHNISLVKAGVGFRDFSQKSWRTPPEYLANRYSMISHGIGMSDEWPSIPDWHDWERQGYDGELQEGMTITIESSMGSDNGIEGVKLEQMVLVTNDGYQLLSTFPFEDELLD